MRKRKKFQSRDSNAASGLNSSAPIYTHVLGGNLQAATKFSHTWSFSMSLSHIISSGLNDDIKAVMVKSNVHRAHSNIAGSVLKPSFAVLRAFFSTWFKLDLTSLAAGM